MAASSEGKPDTSTSGNDLPPNLILRPFRPSSSDDIACDNLERHSNQHISENDNFLKKALKSLIQVHKIHPKGLNAMCHNICDEHAILVCEDTSLNPPLIVGVTVANVKTCYWKNKQIKVGWVHGLRVHEDYQRRGIGVAISNALEKCCKKRNVDMLYLTVNMDNNKALKLYERLGYCHASYRAPRSTPLLSNIEVAPQYLVLKISGKAAATLTAQMYSQQDLSLTSEGFEKLVTLAQYECTFIAIPKSDLHPNIQKVIASVDIDVHQQASSDLSNFVLDSFKKGSIKSIGGISLWNGSLYKRANVERFILSKETWQSRVFQAGLIGMIVALWAVWFRFVHGLIWPSIAANREQSSSGGWGVTSVLFLLLEIIAVMGVGTLLQKVANFFIYIFCLDSSRLFAKAYGPFSTGPKRIECLKAALAASKNHAFDQKFGMWIMNVDIKHRDSAAFGKAAFQTQFLQKWLSTPISTEDNGRWKEFDPCAFYDPRDSTALN